MTTNPTQGKELATPTAREEAEDPRMTVFEAGEFLGVTAQTVRVKIREGLIRATKPGRGWRVRLSELRRYEDATANLNRDVDDEIGDVRTGEATVDEILAGTK